MEIVVRDKIAAYRLVELLYNSLAKDDLFSSSSQLSKVWLQDDTAATKKPDCWKNMTKELIA